MSSAATPRGNISVRYFEYLIPRAFEFPVALFQSFYKSTSKIPAHYPQLLVVRRLKPFPLPASIVCSLLTIASWLPIPNSQAGLTGLWSLSLDCFGHLILILVSDTWLYDVMRCKVG